MTPLAVLLTVIGIVALLVAGAALISYVTSGSARSSRELKSARAKARDLENLVSELRELAYQRRDVDASFSFEVTDMIQNHYRKSNELES